jgi:membrane protein YqaA with SNARE-associated domain
VLKPAESAARDISVQVCAVPTDPAPSRDTSARLWLRVLLGIVTLLGGVLLVARVLRPQLEALGRAFVDQFGLAGIAFGSLLADGFHFPLPPQFYMLLAIGAGNPDVPTFLAVLAGSLLGGVAGYRVARQLARFPRVARWLERTGGAFRSQLEGRKAYRSAIIASVTPLPFSLQCYVCGLYRLPQGAFAVILLLRIPKLMVFYGIIKTGWTLF